MLQSVSMCNILQTNIVKLSSLSRLLPTPEITTILCVDLKMKGEKPAYSIRYLLLKMTIFNIINAQIFP